MKRTISWTLAYLLIITFEVLLPARAKGANERVTYLQSQMQEARTKEEAAKAKAAQLHRQIEAATVKAHQLAAANSKAMEEFSAQKKIAASQRSALDKINTTKQSEVEAKLAEAQKLEQMIKSHMPGVTLGGGTEADAVFAKLNDKRYTNFTNPKVAVKQKEVDDATHSLRTILDKMAEIPLTRKEEGIALDKEYLKVRDEKNPRAPKELDAALEECRKQVREDMYALSAKEAEIAKADPDSSVKNALEQLREAEAKQATLERKMLDASNAERSADTGPLDNYKIAVQEYADATATRQALEKELAQAQAQAAATPKPQPSVVIVKPKPSPSPPIPKEETPAVTAVTPSPLPSASPDAPGTMPNLIGLTLDQAMTRLTDNMTIGGDEVGDKPPSQEKALTIFAQTPAPGAKLPRDKKVIVTVKRYGSGKVEPQATTQEQTSGGNVTSDLEGEWEGMLGSGKEAQKASFTISRQNGDYYVSMPGQKATRGKIENGKLVMEGVLDFSGVAPFSFGGPPVESKDTDPARLKIFFSASGDDLNIDVTVTTRKAGEKKVHAGTIHRKKAG